MAATIYEVARKSGVSIGTVSRVLNDSPLTAVTTRERVLQVINELDYQPHALARGLARRKTNAVGVVGPLCNGSLHAEVLRGIQRGLEQHNFDLVLYGIDDHNKKDTFLRRALQQRRVDGVLLVSMPLSGALAVDCKRRRLPLVLVDNQHHQFDAITVDNEYGAGLATQELLRLGYRRFALFAGHYENMRAQARLQDCQSALQEAGIPASDQIIIRADVPEKNAAASAWQSGYAAMQTFLAQQVREGRASAPLALFVTCDALVRGAISAVHDAGLRLPQEAAIVAFHDSELAEEHSGLMIVQQPMAEIGYQAVKRMLALMKHPASPPQQLRIKPQLQAPQALEHVVS